MKQLLALLSLLAAAPMAMALQAAEVRGGWEAYVNGVEHIYEFKVRGDQVTGIYCTDCSDAETLAFVNGKLDASGLSFVVTHVRDDGSTNYQEHVRGTVRNGVLTVMGRGDGAGDAQFEWTMHRDPRGPAPALPPGAAPAPPPWQPPGAWEPMTPAKVIGVWLGGVGMNKQYFIVRKVGDQLLGVVCGRCDNPYTMAVLDNFFIQGYAMTFDIAHEDWGIGPLPYLHRIVAHLSRNEMRFDATQDNMQRIFSMSVTGPIPLQATALH